MLLLFHLKKKSYNIGKADGKMTHLTGILFEITLEYISQHFLIDCLGNK